MEPTILWLIAGAALVAAEVFLTGGIGLLFAGLAALCVGILLQAGMVAPESHLAQWAWFFALTTLWAVILWKPLKKFRAGSSGQTYSNIVGDIAIVAGEGLKKGETGQVQWSGTLMNAQLAEDAPADLLPGSRVRIHAVKGTTLIVTPE